jgi:GNAT superfamily N-acetyltransferase
MNIVCGIKYRYIRNNRDNYVGIYQLKVHKLMRGKRIASFLLDAAITEIRSKYGNIPILTIALPFGNVGLNKKQLSDFYKRHEVKVIRNWP